MKGAAPACVTEARELLKNTRVILRQATAENCDRVRQLLPQVRNTGEYELASWLGLLLVHLQRIMGEHREALSVIERAQEDARRAKSLLATCRVTSLRGIILRDSGQYIDAVDSFRQVLRFAEELGDQQQSWNALTGMGSISNVREDWERSLYWYRRALAVSRTMKDDARRANSLNHLADVLGKRGHQKASLRLRLKALSLVSGRFREHAANINSGIAQQLNSLKDYAEARFYALTAYRLHHRQGNVMGQQDALQTLANCYTHLQKYQSALHVQRKAYQLALHLENAAVRYRAKRALGECLQRTGAIIEASRMLRESAHMLAKINQQEIMLIVSRMEMMTSTEQLRITNRKLEERNTELQKLLQRAQRQEKDLQARIELMGVLQQGLKHCDTCGRVKAEDLDWLPLDQLILGFGVTLFSHSLCGECTGRLFPNLNHEKERPL